MSLNFHQRIDAAEGWNRNAGQPKPLAPTPTPSPADAFSDAPEAYLAPLIDDNDPRFDDPAFIAWLGGNKDWRAIRRDQINEAIDDATQPRLIKAMREATRAITNVTDQQIGGAAVLSMFAATVSLELLKEICAINKAFERTMQAAMDHTPRKATDAYHAYIADCERKAVETGDVSSATGKTREEFEREFAHRFKVAIDASKTFGPKVTELVMPHIERFVSMVRELADKEAQRERSYCAFIALTWKPSVFLATLYRIAEVIEEQGGRGHNPMACARFIMMHGAPTKRYSFEKPAPEKSAKRK